jgi:hypothetical protein
MTIDEILSDLENKVFCRAATIRKLTEVEQINLETQWIAFIQNLLDFGNKRYLRNYSLALGMEVNEDYDNCENHDRRVINNASK